RLPTLVTGTERMQQLVTQLRQMPMPLEERKLHADAKKAFIELEDLSAGYESQLALLSLQRQPLDRCAPPPAQLERLQSRLAEGDLVLGLTLTGQQVIGMALTREQKPGLLHGRIPALLGREFPDLWEHSVFIAGSTEFVDACVERVKQLGAQPQRIHTEGFFAQQG
ncbi:MAG TPA: hypothetical protein PK797_14925, partial [Burkholderiaceae bacterium]|nr:hypothetical protein [Burkholderiaceae bacterium]